MQSAADTAADAETTQYEASVEEKPNSMPDGPTPDSSDNSMPTPEGYKIYKGTKKNDYTYTSRWVTLGEDRCNNSGCKLYDEWETQLYEYLQGGTSTQWQLQARVQHVKGTDDSNYFYYEYYCGINVSGGRDHQCYTSHHATGPGADSFYTSPEKLVKYFEDNSYANTEFPMIGIGVDFNHVGLLVNKHRGYDTCAGPPYPNTLCEDTDEG